MIYRDLALKARESAGWFVVLLGFAIPVSVALDGFLTALVLLAWLIAVGHALPESAALVRRHAAFAIALTLFGWLLLSITWSRTGWGASWSAASKYLDLALIPVFAWAASRDPIRQRALLACLVAVLLGVTISYGTAFGAWDSVPGLYTRPHYPVGFKLSVTHNILVSYAAFVLLLLARHWYPTRRSLSCLAAALAATCICNVVFIVIGRTGYVLVAVLLAYFALTIAGTRRHALLAALAITTLFASAYVGSHFFAARMQDVAWDLAQWKPGAYDETSVGQRLNYYGTALSIAFEHPLGGVGAGAFANAFEDRVRGTSAHVTVNAHNDYLMLAAQAGFPALALLLALYVTLWRHAARSGSLLVRDMMRGLVLTIALGGLFNSLLMDHVEGLFFAWATGLLYASRGPNEDHAG